jgi:hypothetical protein
MNFADLSFTSVLAFATILATILSERARPDARNYAQFASALYGGLALADLSTATGFAHVQIAATVSTIVLALGSVALALAFTAAFGKSPSRSIALLSLALGGIGGIVAAATGAIFISMAVLFASICVILTFAARQLRREKARSIQAIVTGFALLASAAAGMTSGREAQTSLALFSAAALLGTALACAKRSRFVVEEPAALPENVISLVRRQR